MLFLESGVRFHALAAIVSPSSGFLWSCDTGPLPRVSGYPRKHHTSLALRSVGVRTNYTHFFSAVLRSLKFSQVWDRNKSSMTPTADSPRVPRSIPFPSLEVTWKVLHVPHQRRWWEPMWQHCFLKQICSKFSLWSLWPFFMSYLVEGARDTKVVLDCFHDKCCT